jgi:hypothetical protein
MVGKEDPWRANGTMPKECCTCGQMVQCNIGGFCGTNMESELSKYIVKMDMAINYANRCKGSSINATI